MKNAILTFACTILACASALQAQQQGQIHAGVIPGTGVTSADLTAPSTPATTSEPAAADPVVPPAPQSGTLQISTANDDQWHLSVSPYLYFPGIHGTAGALGRNASFQASAADILSNFRFGIMGTVEARRNRILVPLDLMWIRLEDDKAIPFPPALNAVSATVKLTEFILTPKIGIRVIDLKKIKVDALAGIRYWYFGENLQFNPSLLGLNFSKSENWVDPIVGGRITMPLTPKIVFTAAGDVGGWGTGSQLEYQIVGLLGYKLKPNMTLQGGYRYLYVDYAKGGPAAAYVTAAQSGVVFGATLNLK
jgi:hypothetical protein